MFRIAKALGIPSYILVQLSSAATADTFTVFDPPGSSYTIPLSINDAGFIAGYFDDTSSGAQHGFVRAPNGKITVIDVSGSDRAAAICINNSNEISGNYMESADEPHGFLRTSDGTITTFDAPGAFSTDPGCINDAGDIAGGADVPIGRHRFKQEGFIRSADGSFALFKVKNSKQGVFTVGINAFDAAVGTVDGGGFAANAFIRNSDGSVTLIHQTGWLSSHALAINDSNTATGYFDDAAQVTHGFLRQADGEIEQFDAPNASFTFATWLNARSDVAGWYEDAGDLVHGFLRTKSGKITSFDAPGSHYTQAYGINSRRRVVGTFADADGNFHGFLRKP